MSDVKGSSNMPQSLELNCSEGNRATARSPRASEARVSSVVEVLKYEPRARWFLLANVQSTIGSGAAVVALVVLAFARLPSPWAITLVLLADFLPTMLLGPI